MQSEKKVTIDDVARCAQVSKTTVSRFLNGKQGAFSAETRARIEKVINELGYYPDKSAQRLKSTKTHLIGGIIADVSNPFSALLIKGALSVCEAAGYQVFFSDCDNDPQKEKSALEGFIANRVDGLIVNTSGGNDETLYKIAASGVPVVLADRALLSSKKLPAVEYSNEETAYTCVSMLHDCGYEHVAFFTQGNNGVSPRVLRERGYRRGIAEFYPGTEPEVYDLEGLDEAACAECIEKFHSAHPHERIAVLTVNGVTTRKLLLANRSAGFTWGYDFGICSFDDWDWLMIATPGITGVKLQSFELGATAAQLLLEYIEGKRSVDDPPIDVMLYGKINTRGSTVGEKEKTE